MASRLNNILLLTVFLTPLLGAYNNVVVASFALKGLGYEQIKVFFFIVSISLISFFWMFSKPKFKWTAINLSAGLFIGVLFITSVTGLNSTVSFLGAYPYFQGWILYLYLFLFSQLVSQFKIKLEQWAKVLVASSTIVAFLAIKDWVLLNLFHTQVPTYAGRVVSSFGQPNFYAGFLLLSLPFAYLFFKKGNQWMILIMLILITGIFVSYSRSAILLSLILFILALLDQLKIKLKGFLIVPGVLLVALVVALKSSSGIVGSEFSKPILTNNPDLTKESVEKRVYIWPQFLKIAQEKVLTGYGLENINVAFHDYFKANKHSIFEENLKISPVLISLKDLNIDRTHSYILDLFLFSGILGVLTWIILIVLLIKKGRKNFLIVPLITYLIWIQFQNQSLVHLIYFWLIAGLIDKE